MHSIQDNLYSIQPSLRVTHRSRILDLEHKINHLQKELDSIRTVSLNQSQRWIEFSTRTEHHNLMLSDIVYCEAHGNYTRIFHKDGRSIFLSISLKSVENKINSADFIRCHQSYLVNIESIIKINIKDKSHLIVKSGREIPVSRRKKCELNSIMKNSHSNPSKRMAQY